MKAWRKPRELTPDDPPDEQRTPRRAPVVTVADIAECGCPDWCNRDHDNE